MDILSDEHEREEAVRNWWHEHWKPIILGIVIALAGLVGVRQYQAWQLSNDQETALQVYQLQNELQKTGVKAFGDAQAFLDKHKDIYGSILALDMANVKLSQNDYEGAQEFLSFAKSNGGELLAPQTTLVIARLEAQQQRYDEALATLASIKSNAYKADIAEARGDILLAKGDMNAAHDAYNDAIKYTLDAKLPIRPILQRKFDNVIKPGDKPAYKIMAEQAEAEAAALAKKPDDAADDAEKAK